MANENNNLTNAATKPAQHNSPGSIILQWLMYAFWGWTAIAIFLTSVVVVYFYVDGGGVEQLSSYIPYCIAALLVLLPIAVVCDVLYAKKEPVKKFGMSSVVMVIHAVIFAICGVGALIAMAFDIINIAISSYKVDNTIILWCSMIMVVVYALLFVRTILPARLFLKRRLFAVILSIISVILIVLALTGPVRAVPLIRNDELIENKLVSLSIAIDDYVEQNDSLPSSLNDLNLTGDTKKLVDKKLVTYKNDGYENRTNSITKRTSLVYRYQLCVNFEMPRAGFYGEYEDRQDYEISPHTYSHKKGKVCYKLEIDSDNFRKN